MNRNTVFLLLFLTLIAVIGYTWYRYLQAPEDTGTEQARFTKSLAEVRRLKNLELDTSLFQDRFFRDLQAPRDTPQLEVTPGRENPFASFR